MKKTLNIGTRLVAWLLVFVMVLGYVPASVFAEEETTDTPVVEDTAGESEETSGESAAVLGDSEKTLLTAQVTVNEQDKGKQSYTVKVLDSNGQDVTDNCSFNWTVSNAGPGASDEESSTSTSPVVNGSQTATAAITYQGMQLEVNCSGKTVEDTKLTASTSEAAAVVGAAYAPEAVTVANGNTDGAVWSYELDAAYFTNGVATTKTEAETQLGTYTLTYKASEDAEAVVLAELAINGIISEPTFTTKVVNDNDQNTKLDSEVWYSAAQNITVQTVANVVLDSYENLLPALTVDTIGEGEPAPAWTTEDNRTFTYSLKVEETTVITAGDISCKVGIDSTLVEITGAAAYIGTEGTVVKLNYTVGESGIASVVIKTNAGVKTFTEAAEQYLLEGITAGEITEITITNKAGVSDSYENVPVSVVPALSVKLNQISGTIVGTNNGTTYLKDEVKLEVEIANASNGVSEVSAVCCDAEGNEIAAKEVTEEDGKYYITVAGGDSNIKVTVTDGDDRIDSASFDGSFTYENEAPVIDITGNVDDGIVTSRDDVLYTVTVTDECLTITDEENAENTGSIEVTYVINGVAATAAVEAGVYGTYTCEIPVKNGETLESITVSATDNHGATATKESTQINTTVDQDPPKVTVAFSTNVIGTYNKPVTDEEGNVISYMPFLILEQNEEQTMQVVMTVTANDANLDADWMVANGWTQNEDGTWTANIEAGSVDLNNTSSMDYAFKLKDAAGSWLTSDITAASARAADDQIAPGVTISAEAVTNENGEEEYVYSGTLYLDRRAPSSNESVTEAPSITLNLAEGYEDAAQDVNGLDVYTDSFKFTVTVTDESGEGFNSDLELITWELDDGINGVDFLSTEGGPFYLDGAESATKEIDVTWIEKNGRNETAAAKLTITVVDKVGNQYVYVTNFGFDNLAPRVTVTYDNNEPDGVNEEGVGFYASGRTATVKIEDLNYSGAGVVVNTNGTRVVKDMTEAGTVVYEFKNGGDYTFEISAEDLAGNLTADANVSYVDANGDPALDPHHFYTDCTAPQIEVEKTVAGSYVDSTDAADYYNGEVTYKVTITDESLDVGETSLAVTMYGADGKLADAGVVAEENLVAGMELDTVTYTFTVKDGSVVTDMVLVAKDGAGNAEASEDATSNLTVSDVDEKTSFAFDNGKWTYGGKDIIVDMTAPVITVTKSMVEVVKNEDGTVAAENPADYYAQSYNGIDYYSGEVTYTIEISDQFLENGSTLVQYSDGTGNVFDAYQVPENAKADEGTVSADVPPELETETVTYIITLTDGDMLTDIVIKAVDSAGNTINSDESNLTVVDENNSEDAVITAFEYTDTNEDGSENKTWSYTGNAVVVDMTKPTASISFSENVVGAYTNETGTIYLELENPTVGESGAVLDGKDKQTIEIQIDIDDKNITDDQAQNLYYVVTSYGELTIETQDGKPQAGLFTLELTVVDLAGNPLEVIETPDLKKQDGDETVITTFEVTPDDNGVIEKTISVDRRRASSYGDDKAPTIVITPRATAKYTAADGETELYNDITAFDLHVTDGTTSEEVSGVKSISWVLTDKNGFVNAASDSPKITAEENYEIPVTYGIGESNDVRLEITVVDNVGNTITYAKNFAVDNLAPRVTVSYDNNSVLNEKYFKEDRIATIRVEDINFNALTTDINTEVTVNGWSHSADGKVHTATCTYNVDGEYTFSMTSTDLANKTTVNEGVQYVTPNGGTAAAYDAFVIDKTAPVIDVTYNPTVPVDKDDMGVWFFDQDRRMTVTITEKNFNGAEVVAELGAKNTLSAWAAAAGDTHIATTTFTEGNNYSATIDYTDLAGNPAVTYTSETFSVDTHEPTITITKGDLTNSALNIVQGDLSLAFTINDEQENLKDVTVTLMHLDNQFNMTEVSGAEYYASTWTDARTTVVVDFANIAAEKANDGLYFVRINAQDYAGHYVSLSPEMSISLNRFGSSFKTDDSFTQEFLTPNYNGSIYKQSVSDALVITEINPNKVWQDSTKTEEGSVITVAVNGETYVLEKGTDYQVDIAQEGNSSNKYYVYTYSINPDVFSDAEGLVNGQYSLLFYSEDEAGNKNTNETNVDGSIAQDGEGNYSGKVSFTLDDQEPVVTVIGITDDQRIQAAYQRVEITTSDNTPVVGIQVLVDDVLVQQYDSMEGLSDSENWLYYDEESGTYTLNLAQKNSRQNISIVATDAAGNEGTRSVENVLVSANGFIQFINNIWLVLLALVLLLALIFIIIILFKKRKKDEDEEQA